MMKDLKLDNLVDIFKVMNKLKVIDIKEKPY